MGPENCFHEDREILWISLEPADNEVFFASCDFNLSQLTSNASQSQIIIELPLYDHRIATSIKNHQISSIHFHLSPNPQLFPSKHSHTSPDIIRTLRSLSNHNNQLFLNYHFVVRQPRALRKSSNQKLITCMPFIRSNRGSFNFFYFSSG
jgi:hypothetical protein